MPTKFIVYRWMCDYCSQIYDTEPECILHERRLHKQEILDKDEIDLDAILNQVLLRMKQNCYKCYDQTHVKLYF
jgi:hypothetical protein